MARLVDIWIKTKRLAKRTPSKTYCKWAPDGQSFSLHWSHVQGLQVNLSQYQTFVHQESVQLTKALEDLVPFLGYSTFSLTNINDNPEDSLSLFHRADNIATFAPYVEKLWAALNGTLEPHNACEPLFTKDGGIRKTAARNWLKTTQIMLNHILVNFCHTCGITPRAWQMVGLLYAKLGLLGRNICLDCAHQVTVGNLKAKQLNQLMSDAFWVLHHQLGKALIFYLGVIRPVEMKLIIQLEGQKDAIQEHSYRIFVHNTPKSAVKLRTYAAEDLNKQLKSVSFAGLAMEARGLRVVSKSIYKQHLSHLGSHAVLVLLERGANLQAQHTQQTGDMNYARNDLAEGALVNVSDQNIQYAISKAFQKWFSVDDVGAMEWTYLTSFQDSSICSDHQEIAFALARVLVIDKYGLAKAGAGSEDIAKQARYILQSQPYLFGPECTSTDSVSLQILDSYPPPLRCLYLT